MKHHSCHEYDYIAPHEQLESLIVTPSKCISTLRRMTRAELDSAPYRHV